MGNKDLKTFKVIEYSTGDFGDIGKVIGEIKAYSSAEAKGKYQLKYNIKDSEIGFYGFSEIKEVKNTPKAKDLVEEARQVLSKEEIKSVLDSERATPIQYTSNENYVCNGLTKLEYFASLAMQGLIVNSHENGYYLQNIKRLTNKSVEIAKNMLESLKEVESNNI